MSAFYATVNAYDVMDGVFIVLSVRTTGPDRSEAISTVFHSATTIPGVGETDPRQWAEDALIGLLETL